MAREYPTDLAAMAGIFGMGEKKREAFGELFAGTIREFLQGNSRQQFQ